MFFFIPEWTWRENFCSKVFSPSSAPCQVKVFYLVRYYYFNTLNVKNKVKTCLFLHFGLYFCVSVPQTPDFKAVSARYLTENVIWKTNLISSPYEKNCDELIITPLNSQNISSCYVLNTCSDEWNVFPRTTLLTCNFAELEKKLVITFFDNTVIAS